MTHRKDVISNMISHQSRFQPLNGDGIRNVQVTPDWILSGKLITNNEKAVVDGESSQSLHVPEFAFDHFTRG